MMKCMQSKAGFGIMEVVVAALVLGFMFVALNILQMGNRESIIRVRARDAANEMAQGTIDSLAALGPASVQHGCWACETGVAGCNQKQDLCKKMSFKGPNNQEIELPYKIMLEVKDDTHVEEHKTNLIEAGGSNATHKMAKQVDVTVSWKFKNSDQSINLSAIIR